MKKEEFQKKYDNSIIVCGNDTQIGGVFNICDFMNLKCYKSEKCYKVFIGQPPINCSLFHVEQFLNDFYNEVTAAKEKKPILLKTVLFKQRMKDAEERTRRKYNNSFIKKGTDMGTVEELIKMLDMIMCITDDAILVGEGGKDLETYQARQFITDVMANMCDVLYPFVQKEIMIEIKESDGVEHMMNEAEFYITNIFTAPLHKIYDTQRKVYSIGFGDKEKAMIDEEDFLVFLKTLYYMYKCNDWIKKDDEKNKKEPTFKKGNRIMYTIEDSNGNTHAVTRLSERVYESKEHRTLFITDEEGIVTGIYKEK